MNILLVNRALGTLFGGGESFDYNAARNLILRGHKVSLVTAKPLLGQPKNRFPDLEIVYVSTPNLRRYAYATEKLNTLVSASFYHFDNALFEMAVMRWFAKQPKKSFDIVQCCSLFALPKQLIEKYEQPTIAWLPGPPSGRVRNRLPSLVSIPHFGLFTHGSPKCALQQMNFVQRKDFEIIEPGVELSLVDGTVVDRKEQRKTVGLSTDELLGITTARLVPVKNHQLLLKALASANQRGVRWHWLFVGDGPLESELKSQANALGISGYVHFLGHQNQEEVHRWLSAADLFALTSSYENFSIATLEAMAHRLPIIGSEVGYLKVLIAESKAGRIISSTNVEPLAAALVEFSDSSNRLRYGQAGRQYVERLNWPNIAERLECFYLKVIKGGSR